MSNIDQECTMIVNDVGRKEMQHDAVLFPTECPCGSIAFRVERAFDAGNAVASRLYLLWRKLEGQHTFNRTSTSRQTLSGVLDLAVQMLKKAVHEMARSSYLAIANDANAPDDVRAAAASQAQIQEAAVKNSQSILDEEQHFAPARHYQRFLNSIANRITWAIEGKLREMQHKETKGGLMKAVRDASTIISVRVEKARLMAAEKIHEHGGKADFERNVAALEELLTEAASLAANDEHHRTVHAIKASNIRRVLNNNAPIIERTAALGNVATESIHELASSTRLALLRAELALHLE